MAKKEEKKKEAPLGSGLAQKARKALKGRQKQLDEAEKAAMGEARPSMSKKWTE